MQVLSSSIVGIHQTPFRPHFEPTQGDISEASNDPTQAKRNEFEELYASANEELYPGCDYVTRLDFMAKLTYFKAKGKLTDSIFKEMLEFFQNVFPTTKGYKLPPSYYAIKKIFKTIGLGYESIHACVNDCFLFGGDANKDVHLCPMCNTSRWKDSNTPGKKVPKKVLHYFSIIPRLQRVYKSSHTTKEMNWHATRKCTEPGKMQHPVDGRARKDFDAKYSNFAAEPRNVLLGLAADGFNPFGNLSQSYSMWPVILTTYNLPLWLCMKESSFMLTLLIPGPKSPSKDIDVYLRPLINDLKDLWAKPGVETIDVATGLKFNMRAMVLWAINDFSARSSLSGCSGKGYKACPTCNEDTPSVRVLDPPKEFSRDAIMTQLARLPTRVKGKHPRLQQYLALDVAKPLIELCLFFKQICSQTLMVDDMLKAHSKVIDILCNLELIYPPAFFDIMIHLVIYLPLEAIFGGPIRPSEFPNKYMKEEFSGWFGKQGCLFEPGRVGRVVESGVEVVEWRDEDIFSVNDQDDTLMFDADKDLQGEEVVVEKKVAGKEVSVVEEINATSIATSVTATTTTAATTATISMDEITLAKALIEIKTSRPKAKGIVM
nr:hypothetical protein [Tanacetum cinerariifolium]